MELRFTVPTSCPKCGHRIFRVWGLIMEDGSGEVEVRCHSCGEVVCRWP